MVSLWKNNYFLFWSKRLNVPHGIAYNNQTNICVGGGLNVIFHGIVLKQSNIFVVGWVPTFLAYCKTNEKAMVQWHFIFILFIYFSSILFPFLSSSFHPTWAVIEHDVGRHPLHKWALVE